MSKTQSRFTATRCSPRRKCSAKRADGVSNGVSNRVSNKWAEDILDAMDVTPSQLAYREFYNILISAVAPRPIAWVSSLSASGQPNLAPFSFFNAVCANPPLLAFAPAMRLPKKSEAAAGEPAGVPAGFAGIWAADATPESG